MSNHMSPNDIQIIFANVPFESDTSYTVTGQKHRGIIWFIEKTVSELCSALWFERAEMKDRLEFMNKVLKYAADTESDPVLLFPEG
jgi:glycerol-3-phosphate O-acyltransferase 3/4